MGAVKSVAKAVTKSVEDVAKTVDNTVQSAIDDPVNTAIRVGGFIVGGPAGLAAANAAISIGQGADLDDVAENAAKDYVKAQIAAQVGASVGGETGNPLAGSAASGATRSTLSGGDPLQGAISGTINSGLSSAAKSISDQNLENWSQQEGAKNYENSTGPTEQDVLAADPSIKIESPLSSATGNTGAGYFDEQTGKFIPAEYGQYNGPLTDASGTNLSSMDGYTLDQSTSNKAPLSGSDLLEPPSSYEAGSYDPIKQSQIQAGLKFFADPIVNDLFANNSGLPSLRSNQSKNQEDQKIVSAKLLAGDKLEGDSTGDPYYLQNLRQLYGSLTPNMTEENTDTVNMASGGSTTNQDPFAFATTNISKTPFIAGGQRKTITPAPLQQLKTNVAPTRMAHGGLPQKYAEALPEGHKPEFITGLTGYYASGKGTGQSDDIDAMLHDGDYVADADLVAALGDGSSKAGAEALEKFRRQIPHNQHAEGGAAVPAKIADGEYVFPASFVTAIGGGDNKAGAKILDKMREAIRAHKRSAPTTKIPPKAKSPLDYLKMVKG